MLSRRKVKNFKNLSLFCLIVLRSKSVNFSSPFGLLDGSGLQVVSIFLDSLNNVHQKIFLRLKEILIYCVFSVGSGHIYVED